MDSSWVGSWLRSCSHGARAIGRDLEVESDVALGAAEAKKCLAERGEDRAGIASEPGAEMLRAVEDARALEEIDAAVDLLHVAVAERIERKLCGHGLAGQSHCPDGRESRLDPGSKRFARAHAGHGRADRIVRLPGTAARHGCREHAMDAATGSRREQIAHRRKKPVGRT